MAKPHHSGAGRGSLTGHGWGSEPPSNLCRGQLGPGNADTWGVTDDPPGRRPRRRSIIWIRRSSNGSFEGVLPVLYTLGFLAVAVAGSVTSLLVAGGVSQPWEALLYVVGLGLGLYALVFFSSVVAVGVLAGVLKLFFDGFRASTGGSGSRRPPGFASMYGWGLRVNVLLVGGLLAAAVLFTIGLTAASVAVAGTLLALVIWFGVAARWAGRELGRRSVDRKAGGGGLPR